MEDLSYHILDIVENSLRAGADDISIIISELDNNLNVEIADDGVGMDTEILSQISDPFFTTKSVRKIGLGVALFKEAAEITGGYLKVQSEKGRGTKISAMFHSNHIDCKPLGDIMKTISTLIFANPTMRFRLLQTVDGETIEFDTQESIQQNFF